VSEADPTAPPLEPGKRVTWAELFFDLVFVVAVTRVSALIEDEQSWAGLGRAVVVFVPVYWLWVGTTIQANLRDLSPSRAAAAVVHDRARRGVHGARAFRMRTRISASCSRRRTGSAGSCSASP
jgi:hypothetical protein